MDAASAFPNLDQAKRENNGQKQKHNGPDPQPLILINPADLDGKPVPAREWIVEDWLPVGATTACYGDGGVGKTLLAQQLMTATAIGSVWCGYPLTRCKSLGLFCEDSQEELHRRQVEICSHYGISLSQLSDMRWISGLGQDNILATFTSSGLMEPTKHFYALVEAAKDFGARLVPLDTAADLFGGNENDRGQVRRFIGLLSRFAIEINGAVLLNAHPSRTGLNSGNLDGGSTAWSNSVRSRWSLARPDTEDEAPHEDTAERVLTRRKANYASIGDTIKLRWTNGVLVPSGLRKTEAAFGAAGRAEADDLFLTLLDRCSAQERRVSDSRHATNFAPKVFAKRTDAKGYSATEFERAMNRLFTSKKITNTTYGRPGDARQRISRVPNAA